MTATKKAACYECGEPLDVTARADATYCSGACRQRAYRARKRILNRYGSWENALKEIVNDPFWKRVTPATSRNAERSE